MAIRSLAKQVRPAPLLMVGRLLIRTPSLLSCDGTYSEFCDSSREYKNMTRVRVISVLDVISF